MTCTETSAATPHLFHGSSQLCSNFGRGRLQKLNGSLMHVDANLSWKTVFEGWRYEFQGQPLAKQLFQNTASAATCFWSKDSSFLAAWGFNFGHDNHDIHGRWPWPLHATLQDIVPSVLCLPHIPEATTKTIAAEGCIARSRSNL